MDQTTTERILLLKKYPYFNEMDEELLEQIAPLLKAKKFLAGEMVNWEGDPGQSVYFVKSGWLKVAKTSGTGRELTLNLLKKGDLFNLISIFSNGLNPANVIALEDAALYQLDAASFYQLLRSSPEMCLALVRLFATRVHALTELAGHLSFTNVENRIARWLLNESSGDVILRKKWLTQNELAALVGTVPDVMSRVLRDFVEDGLIRFDRREIRILDRRALTEKI